MLVRDRMTSNPVTVPQATTLQDALTLIRSRHFRHLPIVEPDGELVGIVTEKDLVLAVPSPTHSLSVYETNYFLSQMTVAQVMKRKVITVSPDLPIEEAARIMADKEIGCLPVMKGSILTGIITESDLFNAFVNMFGARHAGVRVSFCLDEKPGQLAKFTQKIAEADGNLVSVVTAECCDITKRQCTCKITGIEKSIVEQALLELDAIIEDIRIMK